MEQAGGEVVLSSKDSTKKAYHNVSRNLQIPTSGTFTFVQFTEGPPLTRFLGLGKIRVKRKPC